MRLFRVALPVAAVAATLVAVTAGFGSTGPRTAAMPTTKCNGDKLTFQLGFFPNAQHAGFLVADSRGYYTQAGLKVTIKPGGPTIDPVLLWRRGP